MGIDIHYDKNKSLFKVIYKEIVKATRSIKQRDTTLIMACIIYVLCSSQTGKFIEMVSFCSLLMQSLRKGVYMFSARIQGPAGISKLSWRSPVVVLHLMGSDLDIQAFIFPFTLQ